MTCKRVVDQQLGVIDYHKRRAQRSIRIRIKPDLISVSLPYYLPYRAAQEFVSAKTSWILKRRISHQHFSDGMRVGKNHRLILAKSSRVIVKDNQIRAPDDQPAIQRGVYRALSQEAKSLLPERIERLAQASGLRPVSYRFRRMETRWGSCNSTSKLNFNTLLMQLPWPLIDYVIIHELCHLKQLNHSPKFWDLVEEQLPNYQELRKQLNSYRPVLIKVDEAEVDKL